MAKPESTTSQRILKGREREQAAVKLRMGGATYEEIGATLGITAMAAYKAVKRALARVIAKTNEDASELRTLELQRLDKLLLALWGRASKGDDAAVDRVLRVMERRAKLRGLDAPVQVSGPDGGPIQTADVSERSDAERIRAVDSLVAALRARGGAADSGGADAVDAADETAVGGTAQPGV